MATHLIIDGNAICHRAAATPLAELSSGGVDSGVVYGFLRSLVSIFDRFQPAAITVAWDSRSDFRKALSDTYKAGRPVSDKHTTLYEQMGALQGILPHMGIRSIRVAGVEADDIIGILSRMLAQDGHDVIIVSQDKDLYQLLSERVTIFNLSKMVTANDIYDKYGIPADRWVELKALTGDKSDNIDGVKGIGPATASRLLSKIPLQQALDSSYTPDDPTLAKLVNKVRANASTVMASYALSQILTLDKLSPTQQQAFLALAQAKLTTNMSEVWSFIHYYSIGNNMTGRILALVSALSSDSYDSIEALQADYHNCTRCPLHKDRTQVVFGTGPVPAKLMLIGEAPGASEDFFGKPFVGLAGGYLSQLLDRVGLSRGNIYITNVVLCRPHTATANRPPTPAEKLACRNRLIAEIRLVQPRVVALLGDVALHALFPDRNSISRERGAYLYHEDFPGVTFIATFHPSMLMRIQQGMVTNQGLQGAHPDIHRALFDWHMIRDKVVEG